MKITKHKNILGLLYGLLLLIPFASVFARTAYVSMNKNAYQSYSGSVDSYTQIVYDYDTNDTDITSASNLQNSLVDGNIYLMRSYFELSTLGTIEYFVGNYSALKVLDFMDMPIESEVYVRTRITNTSNAFIIRYNYVAYVGLGNGIYYNGIFTIPVIVYDKSNINYDLTKFDFIRADVSDIPYHINSIEISTLDNAFEYSLKEITNNDIGKVRFFTWFADMFLDVNDGTSAIYIGFINWYFNYALLMSLGYVLFGVLMWFINWVRRMIERGQDFGQGGF